MKQSSRIYLSGPISGTADYMERFRKVQEILTAEGYRVINPANLRMVFDEGATWDDYMMIDLELLRMSDVLVQLPGWERSLGCQREYGVALARDMIILRPEDLIQ